MVWTIIGGRHTQILLHGKNFELYARDTLQFSLASSSSSSGSSGSSFDMVGH